MNAGMLWLFTSIKRLLKSVLKKKPFTSQRTGSRIERKENIEGLTHEFIID